ncbi:MAG: DUF5333 domain-containing protein [Pseudomonadota bacterium]
MARLIQAFSIAAVCAATAGTMTATPGWAGMADEADINQGLVYIAAADKIRRECSSINGRLFKAQRYANGLRKIARDRGYSDADIDAYLDSKEERAKVRAQRNVYFESQGASNLDPVSLCTLGHAEIAGKTQIGYMLRAK